jgi:hypothetical protein
MMCGVEGCHTGRSRLRIPPTTLVVDLGQQRLAVVVDAAVAVCGLEAGVERVELEVRERSPAPLGRLRSCGKRRPVVRHARRDRSDGCSWEGGRRESVLRVLLERSTMSCPTCGGSQYRLIAPGLAECVESLERPTGMHPSGARGPAMQAFACGTRYQVPNTSGLEVPYCACGLQSIGRCTECGLPLCLDHLVRTGSGALCLPHYRTSAADAEKATARARQSAEDRLRGLLRDFAEASRRLRPDFEMQHRQSEGVASALQGSPCPVHGPRCRAATVLEFGRFKKTVSYADFGMGAWVVGHLCRTVHRDLHSPGTSGYLNADIVGISAVGELFFITYGSGITMPLREALSVDYHRGTVGPDTTDLSGRLLTSLATIFPGSVQTGMTAVSDRIEAIMAGQRGAGSLVCQ